MIIINEQLYSSNSFEIKPDPESEGAVINSKTIAHKILNSYGIEIILFQARILSVARAENSYDVLYVCLIQPSYLRMRRLATEIVQPSLI